VAERAQVRELDQEEGVGCGASAPKNRLGGHLATAQTVLLSAHGMPVSQIAEVTFTSPDRVRNAIRKCARGRTCSGPGLSARRLHAWFRLRRPSGCL